MSTVNHLGIDLSGDRLDLYLADPDGRPLIPAQRFTHNRPGSQAAVSAVLAACRAQPADQLVIGPEATGLLWWHLYHQWAADPQLADLHPVFYLLNPAAAHGFRRALAPKDKTDQVDPRLIAQYLSVPGLAVHPWVNQLEQWSLRFLTRYRCHLAHTVGAYKSYAHTWIYLLASAYEDCKPFSDLFGKTSLDILQQYPTLDSLAQMPVAEPAEQTGCRGQTPLRRPR
jgi:transposase